MPTYSKSNIRETIASYFRIDTYNDGPELENSSNDLLINRWGGSSYVRQVKIGNREIRLGPSDADSLIITSESAAENSFANSNGTLAATFHFGVRGNAGVTPVGPTTIKTGMTTNSSLNNRIGINLRKQAGPGTGSNQNGGDHIWQTPDAGAAGTTLQTQSTKMTLFREGELLLSQAGTEATPVLRIGNRATSGFYEPSSDEMGYSSLGLQSLRTLRNAGVQEIRLGYDVNFTTFFPSDVVLRPEGHTLSSLFSDADGPVFSVTAGPGTGTGQPGYINISGFRRGTVSNSTPSGTTSIIATFRPEDSVNVNDGPVLEMVDVASRLYVGCSKLSTGAAGKNFGRQCLILGDVGVSTPVDGPTGAGILFVEGINLKFKDSTGLTTTIV